MASSDPIAVWLLPTFVALGFGVSFYLLSEQELRNGTARRLVRLSAEIGGVSGAIFWLVLKWLGFGSGTFGPHMLGQAVVRAALWGVFAWPFAAWRLERVLGLPHWRSYDLTTRICGIMLLVFFIVGSAAVIISYL
jgi:hypothetical protein